MECYRKYCFLNPKAGEERQNGIGIRKGNEENRQGILEPPEMAELTELNRAN